MAVLSTELDPTDDVPRGTWVPVAEAAARIGAGPTAVRRAIKEGRVTIRQEVVGRRSRTLVLLSDVVGALGQPAARVDEAMRRADDAIERADRAEELTRFFRRELEMLHAANEVLQREVARLSRDTFRTHVSTACDGVRSMETDGRRRLWRRAERPT